MKNKGGFGSAEAHTPKRQSNVNTMTVEQFLYMIKRNYLTGIFAIVVIAVITVAVVLLTPARYTSEATILLTANTEQKDINNYDALNSVNSFISAELPTVIASCNADEVLDSTRSKVNFDRASESVECINPVGTKSVVLRATSSDAQKSSLIANTVAAQLAIFMDKEVYTNRTPPPIGLKVIQKAEPSNRPSSPSLKRAIVMGGFFAVLAALISIFVKDYLARKNQ